MGNTPDAIMKGKKGKGKGSPEKKGKKKNPWSDSDASDVDGSNSFILFVLNSLISYLSILTRKLLSVCLCVCYPLYMRGEH